MGKINEFNELTQFACVNVSKSELSELMRKLKTKKAVCGHLGISYNRLNELIRLTEYKNEFDSMIIDNYKARLDDKFDKRVELVTKSILRGNAMYCRWKEFDKRIGTLILLKECVVYPKYIDKKRGMAKCMKQDGSMFYAVVEQLYFKR